MIVRIQIGLLLSSHLPATDAFLQFLIKIKRNAQSYAKEITDFNWPDLWTSENSL